MPEPQRPVVAIFNSSVETLEILRDLLMDEGFLPVTGHVDDVRLGKLDLLEFVRGHDPAALVWDIAPPYGANYTFLKLVRTSPEIARVPLVITTTNVRVLREEAGVEAIELVGKPFDLQQLVDAVRERLSEKRGSSR